MGKLDEWAARWKLQRGLIIQNTGLGEQHLRELTGIIHQKLRLIQSIAISSGGVNLISSISNFATELDSMGNQLPKSDLQDNVKKAATQIRDILKLKKFKAILESSIKVTVKINAIFPEILDILKSTILKHVIRELKTLEDLEREIGRAA